MGATASGKSSLAIEFAEKIRGEIISADSAQIFRDLSIITARTTPAQMQGIPHHLTGFLDLGKPYSVADFQKDAYRVIEEILDKGKIPILTGGTHLYLKAVIEAYEFVDIEPDSKVRDALNVRLNAEGSAVLYRELSERDPEAASRIHPNNTRRVVRALEVMEKTGRKFSDFYRKSALHPLGITPVLFRIDMPREIIYERINRRVDRMIRDGAVDEIMGIIKKDKKNILAQAKILGCSEIMAVLDGFCTLKEGIDLLKRNTRRYAKRQLTWMKSFNDAEEISHTLSDEMNITAKILDRLKRIPEVSG